MLSEVAVLGFEYGYRSPDRMRLTLWEAQFGISPTAPGSPDQFISSSERKWLRLWGSSPVAARL